MKDVSLKPDSLRQAEAVAVLHAPAECIERLRSGDTEKGDPLKTARVAGILAAKRCDELIPLCHPLPIYRADVDFELAADRVAVRATVLTIGATGVEMEALLAANLAALTIYDMLKPYCEPEQLWISDSRLLVKQGGKSHFVRHLSRPRRASVIVLSDRVAAGEKADTAGLAAGDILGQAGFEPVGCRVLPDDADALRQALQADREQGIELILTVGGTGLGPRDITVDTVQPMLDKEIPGLMETARGFGQRRTPYAMLSRGVAGLSGNSLIITLPGSRRAVEESMAALLPGIVHLIDVHAGADHPGGYAA